MPKYKNDSLGNIMISIVFSDSVLAVPLAGKEKLIL